MQRRQQQELAPEASSLNNTYNQYQYALKQTFENTRAGMLVEAGHSLLEISKWLLSDAEKLSKTPCSLVELTVRKDNTQLKGSA